jgi:RimJ/RimL family protein N-acetyltransferase
MELAVMTHNRSAVTPYEKSGFVVQGTRRDSMLVEGNYVDEYYRARLLD